MADYAPVFPYGSRWNYRTPSPPPQSVIEPISPLPVQSEISVPLPENLDVLPVGRAIISSTPTRLQSHDEHRSDSTLSLLSSVSSPTLSSRRLSPNRRSSLHDRRNAPEVPTFAGNQYFDPLAFFADVALSSADPTTLPKLQQLAAKDAAQRLEASPENSSISGGDSRRRPAWESRGLPRRQQAVESAALENTKYSGRDNVVTARVDSQRSPPTAISNSRQTERIELAPIRDLTPPSSNSSIAGHSATAGRLVDKTGEVDNSGPSHQSPPPARFPAGNSNSDVVFSVSPSKRNKTEATSDSTIESTTETSTETPIIEGEATPANAVPRNSKSKKGRAKPSNSNVSSTSAVYPETPATHKGKGSKSKKVKTSTPSIAVRRSTRKIKFIDRPEDEPTTPLNKLAGDREATHSQSQKSQASVSGISADNDNGSEESNKTEPGSEPLDKAEENSASTKGITHNSEVIQNKTSAEILPHKVAERSSEDEMEGFDQNTQTNEAQDEGVILPQSQGSDEPLDSSSTQESSAVNDDVAAEGPQGDLKERLARFVADWGIPAVTQSSPSSTNQGPQPHPNPDHQNSISSSSLSRENSVDHQEIVDALQRGPTPTGTRPIPDHWKLPSPPGKGAQQSSNTPPPITSTAEVEEARPSGSNVSGEPMIGVIQRMEEHIDSQDISINTEMIEEEKNTAKDPSFRVRPASTQIQRNSSSEAANVSEIDKNTQMSSMIELTPKIEVEETLTVNEIPTSGHSLSTATNREENITLTTLETSVLDQEPREKSRPVDDAATQKYSTNQAIEISVLESPSEPFPRENITLETTKRTSGEAGPTNLETVSIYHESEIAVEENNIKHHSTGVILGTLESDSQTTQAIGDLANQIPDADPAYNGVSILLITTNSEIHSNKESEDQIMADAPAAEAHTDTASDSNPDVGDAVSRVQQANTEGVIPDSPTSNDLCLVCKSSALQSNQVDTALGQQCSDTSPVVTLNTPWIQCDGCKLWSHTACATLTNEDVEAIDKYHCPSCEIERGPSTHVRKSNRPKTAIDYELLNNGSAVPAQSATNKLYHPYVDKILNGEFKTVKEEFPRVVPAELSIQFFEDGAGFRLPVVIPAAINPYPRKNGINQNADGSTSSAPVPSSTGQFTADIPVTKDNIDLDGLGMGFPDGLTIRKVVDLVGPDELVEVIDVKSQLGDKRKWPLSKWVEYFEDPNRERIYNVLSLEVSQSKLGQMIQRPSIVRQMDLSDQVWPKDKMKEFPNVQYYCLMSVAHAYTDWHVDFGGSSVYYRILKGKKVFFFLEPTRENLEAYQKWTMSPEQSWTWLAEGRQCFRIDLGPGDTMLIPSGWIHAVYTPEDSLVIGGNFLTRLHYNMQFQIHEIEKANNTPLKYKFPRFARVHWYDAIKLLEDDPIPPQVDQQLLEGKVANFRVAKGKGNSINLSEWVLEGLPAFTEFLRRNSLIAQEIITEGLTKQKTDAVKGAIPKGHYDGWDIVQKFARWATWKRNAGEVIPTWAYPDADPADGIPNAGQKKISAAAIKHAERARADAERRALGAVRPGLRERNVSSQFSPSVSNTPAPEEARVKKRPRQSTGDVGPQRKKGRGQKEKLDQAVIDECVKEVIADYEASSDIFKQAMAVEVRTQYRNVHITRLGPSRSACAPCRDGKTKCVHKDEIKALISSVMEQYHTVKGTSPQDRKQAQEDFFGRSPDLEDRASEIPRPQDADRLDAPATPEPKVVTTNRAPVPHDQNASEGSFRIAKRTPHNKPMITPRSKKTSRGGATPGTGEPRRRGGKRTACDACRKSRRKCLHGIPSDAQTTASSQGEQIEHNEYNDDEEPSDGEDSVVDDRARVSSTLSPPPSHGAEQGVERESSPLTPEMDSRSSVSRYATPAEHLLRTEEMDSMPDETHDQGAVPKTELEHPPLFMSTEPTASPSAASGTSPSISADNHNESEKSTDGKAEVVIGTGRPGTQPVRPKRRRGVDAIDRDTHHSNSSPTTTKRSRPAVPQFEEGDSSPPKRAKRDSEGNGTMMSPRSLGSGKLRTTPRRIPMAHVATEQWISPDSEPQNTPEKLAWQENKAAEFGLRNRSKSKS